MTVTHYTQSNLSHFDIIIPGHPSNGLQIIHFESTEYQLDHHGHQAQNYCYQLFCFNPKQIALSTLIAQTATLVLYDNSGKPYYQHGVITQAHDSQQLHHAVQLTLHSPLYSLTCNIQHRVYHQVTLAQLIMQILQQSGWSIVAYQLHFHEAYPKREYVVQYQENDYAFLQRQCAYYGVFFTFLQMHERPILIFCDDIQQLSQIIGSDSLYYYPLSEQVRSTASIFDVQWRCSMVTDNIRIKDYNYRQPDVSLLLESAITSRPSAFNPSTYNPSVSNHARSHQSSSNQTANNISYPSTTDYRYQEHYQNITEGSFLLRVRQEALDCQRKICQIKTDAVYLQPGYLLRIDHHPIATMNGLFYVISVQHFANQAAAFPLIQTTALNVNSTAHNGDSIELNGNSTEPKEYSIEHNRNSTEFNRNSTEPNENSTYYNIAQLIPAHIPFRPAAPDPLYQENTIAKITGTPGNYAPIDAEGCYQIRPLFDTSVSADDCSSLPVRLVHPLNGPHYGMHFPLQCGTEVLLTHINGDPDRPIIMGVLPNLDSLPPVTAVNKSQHILKSRGNNQLVFDDQQQAEHILLQTAHQNNQVLLDATQKQQQIQMISKQGNVTLQAGKVICSQTQNNHLQIVGNNHCITVNKQQQIVSQQGNISFNAATNIIMTAIDAVTLATQHQDIVMQTDTHINIHAEKNAHLTIQQGDLVIQSSHGNLQFQAKQGILLVSSGINQQINISQSGASIQLSAQDIKINSPVSIKFEAKQINLQGNVTLLNYNAESSTSTTNLIMHYQDELGEIYSALNGIYHLLPKC